MAGLPRVLHDRYHGSPVTELAFTHLACGRPVPASNAASRIAWAYDLADNRTNVTHNGVSTDYTLDIGDRLASTSDGATYLYNAAGCVTNIFSVLPVPSVRDLSWNPQYQLTAANSDDFDLVTWLVIPSRDING